MTLENLVLLCLQNKELSGLQILKSINNEWQKNINMGSLYSALHNLEKKALIKSRWGDERSQDRGGARRRYYSLTQLGEKNISDSKKR
jgi:DNA-binding PadR family transcriptional regulator